MIILERSGHETGLSQLAVLGHDAARKAVGQPLGPEVKQKRCDTLWSPTTLVPPEAANAEGGGNRYV